MDKSSSSISSLLEAVVNHVALPPRLPGKADSHISEIEHNLTGRVIDAICVLRNLARDEGIQQWDRVRGVVQACKTLNVNGKLNKTSLLQEFRALGIEDLLILHVAEQNVGLLVRRQNDVRGNLVTFEAFEASALSEKVLASENALQWDFPGSAAAIQYSEFADASFQDILAATLEQASTESIKMYAARTQKAGSLAYESRDTVDPSFITQMLMTLLEANGQRISPPQLRKRVRDDVCWNDGAEKPWRRSAYWLVLRVGLERHLCNVHGSEVGRVQYKFILCLVLAHLIDDALNYLTPEILAFLKAKLTRRLVKLEAARERASSSVRSVYETLFASLGPLFGTTTKCANERITSDWNDFKNKFRRPIPLLRRRAEDKDLILTLPNSGLYVQQVLSWRPDTNTRLQSSDTSIYFKAFADRYFSISDLEMKIEEKLVPESTSNLEERCAELSKTIGTYLDKVADAYDSNPEQKSMMLLTVMELWISMDKSATQIFPLLMDYNSGIVPRILDVLHLPRFLDMRRLLEIQEYLKHRQSKCSLSQRTIFNDPTKGCFAERYFNESTDSGRLQDLYQRIENTAISARARKEEEWRKLRKEFEELEKTISRSTCIYTTVGLNQVIHDDRRCTKCYLQRRARRMKIHIHEDPLPSNPVQAKAVVFELGRPEAFAAYRNATWRILGTLARSKQNQSRRPQLMLCDYTELNLFMDSNSGGVSLASTTKSFLSTHYNPMDVSASLNDVCVPCGLKLGYFDPSTNAWTGRQASKPSFGHHCHLAIPTNSPFSSLQPDFAVDSSDPPSSFEVIADQTRCPSGLNLHEFTAFRSLLSGKTRQWPLMLIELGSTNLNFSTEAITLLMAHLALQAGPAYGTDPLRMTHLVFQDESFCEVLMEQICQRLDGIASNWRETNCIEMLITFLLRMCSLAPKPVIAKALKLLEKAREITSKWIKHLRVEIHRSTDAEKSRRCSMYAFWAALLCRRTFAMHAEADIGRKEILQPEALCCFIECSVTLQDNLASDLIAMPSIPRNALIRDLKMVHRLRFVLRRSLQSSPESLERAINGVWPQPEGDESRSYSEPEFGEKKDEWWITSTIRATQRTRQQTIHYHLLEGNLLVDGQPMGKLPAKHRDSVILGQLFGKQSLLTYPSGVWGMTYTLAFVMEGHQIHIGFRDNVLIVQTWVRGKLLEFVPCHVFGDASNPDLPASLVENCVHWLDLHTGVMEIRQHPDIWKSKSSNWTLDFNTRRASRRTSSLVDPYSQLFRAIGRIFDRFEHRWQLTVYQPESGSLSVELKHLELRFFVNPKKLLQCAQLRAEIDPNQDAGTWYGFNSKLVMRDAINPQQRSVLVPFGAIKSERNRFHVAVDIDNNGIYVKYTINDVLGRLDCAPEPRMLYLKACLHAYTSFVIPDRLTGRTGTEEAFHILKSGNCQPWTCLDDHAFATLRSLVDLTPKREYYPKGLKAMQKIFWNPDFTTTIQHDGFRPLVEAICEKSQQLSAFAFKGNKNVDVRPIESHREDGKQSSHQTGYPPLWSSGVYLHLQRRSYLRRCLYEPPNPDFDAQQAAPDLSYVARDLFQATPARVNVLESVISIRNWRFESPSAPDLAGILQSWPNIGGYDRSFDRILLSDRLDVQFALEWGSLINFCRTAGPQDKYRLMFFFALMSFRNDVEMDLVRILLAFTLLPSLKAIKPPEWPSYTQFRQDQTPNINYLTQLIKPYCVPYPGDERSIFKTTIHPKQSRTLEARELAHQQQTEKDGEVLAQFLLEQWPCQKPNTEGYSGSPLVDVSQAMDIIEPEWLRLFQNMELSHYTKQVQAILDLHCVGRQIELPKLFAEEQEVLPTRCRGGELPSLPQDLLRRTSSLLPKELLQIGSNEKMGHVTLQRSHNCFPTLQNESIPNTVQEPAQANSLLSSVCQEIVELESIIDPFVKSHSTVHQQYGQDMQQSLEALTIFKRASKSDEGPINLAAISAEVSTAREVVSKVFAQLCMAFERDDSRVRWLKDGGLWPCITPVTILEQLRSTSACVFGEGMKESIVAYAVSITILQRLLRIQDAYLKENRQILHEEQKNLGHVNWQPLQHPDWLLLEIDANILIRPEQIDVALATISPASGSNSVLQMNMGQGKTSCIMPMVAAVLADTKKLLRVIVPKPLLLQTAQLLQARLGGLIGREVRHVPFSRKTPTNPKTIEGFFKIHKDIISASGVIVALPEHILSFRLSGLQRLSDKRVLEAKPMVKVQDWMQKKCRDVLDESDITLAVRTQLIYPSGSQLTVDGHPHRWETAKALLRLVEGHLWNLQHDFPRSIEVVRRPQGGFPTVFFLRKDAEDALLTRLVEDVLHGRISIIPAGECTRSDCLAIKRFISDATVQPEIVQRVRELFPDKPAVKQNLYLLRGLLVHRILLLTLKKRWNVQYGLHPGRDPIAVPFHAKGVPSEQAEWGHPDVAILFTCLAFYFGGLDLAQLHQTLENVVNSDDPSSEYDRWTQSSKTLPDSLREWTVINVHDDGQLLEIWQHVCNEVVIIDYYLNHFVFPKHAKQFRMKLQASGWDIPLFSPESRSLTYKGRNGSASLPRPMTTGFSGTNDNRTMLPLTIKQEDLHGLSHTNSEVLTYLLQPRNRRYVLAAGHHGGHFSELGLLEVLKNMNIRVLIDAGAQILEMDNLSLAKAWLKIEPQAPAAVFFNVENKPCVIYRGSSKIIPLSASPFADNVGACLVYLDDAHTRGTDLKMPPDARGALTLGLGQTKDHTVQAAMRLRQVATTQSVVFFAPAEVHHSILDLREKKDTDQIDSHDVICWLLEQTCLGIEQIQPLYYSHGVDFCRRTQAALNNPDFLDNSDHRNAYLSALRQNEQQTLSELYCPNPKSKPAKTFDASCPEIATFMKELKIRRTDFQDRGNAVQSSSLQEVEQEREVAFEVEAVREVQKPIHYSALSFSGLHKDIIGFAETGRLTAGYTGYEPASAALRRTALGRKHGINSEGIASNLFVSIEFTRTVEIPLDRPNDNFLRPVNWVLWSMAAQAALIVIPEEAELLIPLVRNAMVPRTHLLTYAAPITRKMLHFNNLCYYAIPTLPSWWKPPIWLTIELGIFAGRLYFSFEEYIDLRTHLGLQDGTNGTQITKTSDGLLFPNQGIDGTAETAAGDGELERKPMRPAQSFTTKPLTFLQEWLAVRRKGQDLTHTPMGYLCEGKKLTADHPFFTSKPGNKDASGKDNAAGLKNGNPGTNGHNTSPDEDSDEDDGSVEEGECAEGFVDESENLSTKEKALDSGHDSEYQQ